MVTATVITETILKSGISKINDYSRRGGYHTASFILYENIFWIMSIEIFNFISSPKLCYHET